MTCTDVTAAQRAEALRGDLARLGRLFAQCWVLLYGDHRREHDIHRLPDESEIRGPRCGSCEHPADAHDPHCTRQECRCRTVVPYPSTVGWAQWTAPGLAERAYVSATKHLQRANNAVGEIADVPAHWVSDALDRPAYKTTPMPLHVVIAGVDILTAAVGYVGDELAPPECNALVECDDEIRAAVRTLLKAQDRLTDQERQDLARKRCALPWCRVEHHANGLCRQHYDENRRAS